MRDDAIAASLEGYVSSAPRSSPLFFSPVSLETGQAMRRHVECRSRMVKLRELSVVLLSETRFQFPISPLAPLCEYLTMPPSTVESPGGSDPLVEWLRERLRAPQDNVTSSVIPSGFEAYVRILHPVQEGHGEPLVRWADVARWSGVALVPSIQWWEVALPEVTPDAAPPWRSQGPREGSLSHADTIEMVDVLSRRSSELCLFGVWEGYGGGVAVEGPDAQLLPHRVEEALTFELPWRSYELFEGPVEGAMCFHTSRHQSPNLWWPQDRSWCVASEIDLPWTYVAGSRELVSDVLASTRLEALEASPDDPIGRALPSWLEGRIGQAIDEVIDAGSTVVDLAPGTVTATLVRLSRRKSVLETRSERVGGWGAANVPIDTRDSGVMRRDLKSAFERAIFNLVRA